MAREGPAESSAPEGAPAQGTGAERPWLATRLLGQGLYETDRGALPARFRVYRRADGSMHFVRELYCNGALRVFDSDFVVRNGALHEVFPDCGIDIQMAVRVLPGGGLSIRGKTVRVHGIRVPWMPLDVEFVSQVEGGHLQVGGHLRGAGGDHAELGCIHYRVSPAADRVRAEMRIAA